MVKKTKAVQKIKKECGAVAAAFFFFFFAKEKGKTADITTRKFISGKKGDAIMRIEAYNQVAQVYKANKIAGTAKTAKTKAGRDEVQISSFGRDYQIAKQAVADASDIREEKVAEVAAKVNSGNYEVSVDDFAGKLLERYRLFTM